MKEILFRGKRIDNDEWVYGFLRCRNYIDVWTPHTWKEEDGSTGEYATVESYQVDPETVGQYTGLTDKNGKKIFEGDIVKFSHPAFNKRRIGVISYEMNEAGFVLRYKGNYCWIAYIDEFYEVIGNVYNNPELLEVGND